MAIYFFCANGLSYSFIIAVLPGKEQEPPAAFEDSEIKGFLDSIKLVALKKAG